MINMKKRGLIKIPEQIIREEIESGDERRIEALQKIFGSFIPIMINSNFFTKTVDYMGFCDQFDEIEEGKKLIEYEARYHRTGDGEIVFDGFIKA